MLTRLIARLDVVAEGETKHNAEYEFDYEKGKKPESGRATMRSRHHEVEMRSLLFLMMCAMAWPANADEPNNADEPWMYRVAFDSPHSQDKMESMRISVLYSEVHGTRIAENISRMVHESVASFDDIVKWYSDRLKVPDLPEKLSKFNAQVVDDPEVTVEGGTWPEGQPTKTLISHWFTAEQKQITFLLPEESGNIVAISLLGLKTKTRIQIMRHQAEEIAR